ncbi:prolyl oligopeptidase family serine peptidase [Spirosoma sp. HMF4905]|uniref:Prolyl oligopeptidase family serine peptidase n=1 Tax=Spirosoma arboris TaxID=2682092 RepID=A0A7K1SBG9_9BACT|nr:alpha/beta hydrolase-fold protein [Spirosoma arboris]MVM31130.1 prolyl oligopeptidase family serine peptidase [Spirosoma arboris]
MHFKKLIGSLLLSLLAYSYVGAQSSLIKTDSLHSTTLNQQRFIQVILPENYKAALAQKYDVIYVLDGDGNTPLVSQIAQFIHHEGFMPPAIIVGINNIDRNKDLTPTHEEDHPTSGGAKDFLTFIKKELIPYIAKTYPANSNHLLWGHSFGGLFVTYALLNEPELFSGYIAADPSYWWGNRQMMGMAIKTLPELHPSLKRLYISGRQGQGMNEMGITRMDSILQRYAPAQIQAKTVAYEGETHGTIRLKSIYDGLRYVYEGYHDKAPVFHPMNGILLTGKPIRLWNFDDTTKVRYTTDGTTPSQTSSLIHKVLTISQPTTVITRAFTANPTYDKLTTGVFKAGNALLPGKRDKNLTPGGFHYHYYEGQWNHLPDFDTLQAVKEGRADKDFKLAKLPRRTNFGLVLSGQIEIKVAGYYIFALESDDGSRLSLGGQLLIGNDSLPEGKGRTYIVPLQKGFYSFKLDYYQKAGDSSLDLEYVTPDQMNTRNLRSNPIPLELVYGH